jgi:tripartite-type tricarboxylate transporter receptor subunit TctC
MATMASALPHIKSGRIRPLAVSTAKRVAVVPDVPTMQEAGVPGFDYSTWYGIVVPAGTPQPVVDTLNRALVKILATADVKKKFGRQGVEPTSTSPQEFKAYLEAEVAKWATVVKAAGMKVN